MSRLILRSFVGCCLVLLTLACAQSPSNSSDANAKYGQSPYKMHALSWESSRGDGTAWTNYTLRLIHEELANDFVGGADDMETFCPNYQSLSTNERLNVWAMLISAMTKYESHYNPLSRMRETSMGEDPITGAQVFSEGLLQLSYQDTRRYRFCEFDWEADRNLSPDDPKKTILDPYKNLDCGIRILAFQVRNRQRITLDHGAYWSVLKLGSKHRKISEIATLTRQMPGCTKAP